MLRDWDMLRGEKTFIYPGELTGVERVIIQPEEWIGGSDQIGRPVAWIPIIHEGFGG